jgi:hypothetical protein
MLRLWTAWIFLLAVQSCPEAIGQFDWPSPYGPDVPFYGERVVFVLVCFAFVAYIRRSGLTEGRVAMSALIAALLASPEPARYAYPAVMGWAQFTMALMLGLWAMKHPAGQRRLAAGVVAFNQLLAWMLFVYAQTGIGLVPVPTAALYWLHGWDAELAYALTGTLLMIWATRERKPPYRRSVHV